jgi:hypothetical protein
VNGEQQARPPSTALIVTGFVFAFLFPIIGIVIGLFVMLRTGGQTIGLWIFFVSFAVAILSYVLLYAPA